jgi:hypothetical protein
MKATLEAIANGCPRPRVDEPTPWASGRETPAVWARSRIGSPNRGTCRDGLQALAPKLGNALARKSAIPRPRPTAMGSERRLR